MRARHLVGAAAFVFSCTRRRCVGIVFFFSFFPFFLLPPLLLTQHEHFSGAFLSACHFQVQSFVIRRVQIN